MPPRVCQNVLDLVGDTPMLRLSRLAEAEGVVAEIYAKLEFLNPGGSVKDRIAVAMIDDAEARGLIAPGDTLVEPTAGNTGIGLALAGPRRGYRVIVVMPDNMSEEKAALCRALGAEVVRTPAEGKIPAAVEKAQELSETLPRAFILQQFENPANPRVHYEKTGREIYEALGGKVDAVVVGVGTGGTFTGVAKYLKERIPNLLAYAVEPQGSILGGGEPGAKEVEGIGVSFIPRTLDLEMMDGVITVQDTDAFRMVAQIAKTEGLLVGGSSGAAAEAAARIARRMKPGSVVVTLFPDPAERYLTKNIFRAVTS